MSEKKLPILEKAEITLFTHYSLPLLIPFIDHRTIGWYMQNFINIFYRNELPAVLEYCDYKLFYQEVLDTDRFTYDTARLFNKPEWFVKFIDEGKYIYAWVDQYYLSANVFYRRDHDIHPVLIYGYNNDTSEYYCKCFSVKNSVYDATIPMDEYHTALDEASKVRLHINDDDIFCLFKINEFDIRDFSLDVFYSELYHYFMGTGKQYGGAHYATNGLLFDSNEYSLSAFGIEVTKLFANGFFTRMTHFDYRFLHLIWENKHCILKRLCYVDKTFWPNDQLRELITGYGELVKQWDQYRLQVMKKAVAVNKSLYNIRFPDEQASKFQQKALELYSREKKLLQYILNLLSDICVRYYFAFSQTIKADKCQNQMHLSRLTNYNVNGIVLFNPTKHFEGRLIINGRITEIKEVRIQNHLYIPIGEKIGSCVFIPSPVHNEDGLLQMYGVYDRVQPSQYIPSSTNPPDSVPILAEHLGQTNQLYWCANVQDDAPYVDVIFEKQIKANTLFILQNLIRRRIAGIEVQAYLHDKWCALCEKDIPPQQQLIYARFDPVVSNKFRIKFTKAYPSIAGFRVPNIYYMTVYGDFEM